MSKVQTLGPWLERFFLEHIVTERNLAQNTRKSYRDTFELLLPFVCGKLKQRDDRLLIRDVTSIIVLEFLSHLEENRGCSVQTRNQRLTAIRAFARYVGSRDPAHVAWSGQIRAIPSKKAIPQPVGWLTRAEIDAMLATPDRSTPRGRTEYALLQFMYNTGARVSEAAQLKVGDLGVSDRDGRHALVTLHGKGGKTRQCPLLPDVERVLVEQVAGRAAGDAVFLSRYRKPYTRFGVYRLVERCAASVPALQGRKITPHLLRHTIACHLVAAGIDINVVRAWLGHVSINTTNIYAEINLETKARALELCEIGGNNQDRRWNNRKGLMAFLKSL